MGIKIDGVPGRLSQYLSFIKRPGFFYGQCSELCGVAHGFMPIVVWQFRLAVGFCSVGLVLELLMLCLQLRVN